MTNQNSCLLAWIGFWAIHKLFFLKAKCEATKIQSLPPLAKVPSFSPPQPRETALYSVDGSKHRRDSAYSQTVEHVFVYNYGRIFDEPTGERGGRTTP